MITGAISTFDANNTDNGNDNGNENGNDQPIERKRRLHKNKIKKP